jgi:hypothetical protein
MRTLIWSLLGLLICAGTAVAAPAEHMGSWALECPDPGGGSCVLRLDKRLVDKGGITVDLEVRAGEHGLVPVLLLRGLPEAVMLAASQVGSVDASLQFSDGSRQRLDCAPGSSAYVCSPRDDAARKLSADLPNARGVKIWVMATVSGMKPLPVGDRSYALAGTRQALDRLLAAGPASVPVTVTATEVQSSAALVGMADKALRAAGYKNGISDLGALVAKYKGQKDGGQ